MWYYFQDSVPFIWFQSIVRSYFVCIVLYNMHGKSESEFFKKKMKKTKQNKKQNNLV